MKIILSRKGFDSSSGGHPSPILPDGTMVSLPIPEPAGRIRYSDCAWRDQSYYDLMCRLGIKRLKTGGKSVKLTRSTCAHLDPDLSASTRPRLSGWRPLFGQVGGRQTHLHDQSVGKGDVFLFFGWFAQAHERSDGRLSFGGEHIHAIWGWMEIGEVWDVDQQDLPRWATEHPHVLGRGTGAYANNNVLYRASSAGVFPRFSDRLRLTKKGATRSVWALPQCFHPSRTTMTGQRADGWSIDRGKAILRSAPRGQEFVVSANRGVARWLATLGRSATRTPTVDQNDL